MTHRWNRLFEESRAVRCAVVEVPAMSDPFDPRPSDGFAELVPWADPYIAALIEKLRRAADCSEPGSAVTDELAPPPADQSSLNEDPWRGGWRPPNRPGA